MQAQADQKKIADAIRAGRSRREIEKLARELMHSRPGMDGEFNIPDVAPPAGGKWTPEYDQFVKKITEAALRDAGLEPLV